MISSRQLMIPPPVNTLKRWPKGSAYTGALPKGCMLCERGAKMVLLVTGQCASRCFYCPLSKEKKGKPVFYANERRIESVDQALEEASLMSALGTGITGGDPFEAMDRTVESIRTLKKRFGKAHHIHLYTSQPDKRKIAKVAKAGLDEIRFHPPVALWSKLDSSKFAAAVKLARRSGMVVGLELPVIPGRAADLVAAISFADSAGADFVNLNEFEFSETNWRSLRSMSLDVKSDISSAVKGSQELAHDLLRLDASVPLHYCSAAFKDGIQMRRRLLRRARNVRMPHEILTRDGTFLKGIIETDDFAAVAANIMNKYDVPGKLIFNNNKMRRLEIAPWVLEEIANELDYPSFIIEEYPTADRLEVERTPLKRR